MLTKSLSKIENKIRTIGSVTAEHSDRIRNVVLRGWAQYIRTYSSLVCWKHSLLYARSSQLLPFEVLSVDPNDIEFIVEGDGYPQQTLDESYFPDSKFKYAGTVQSGDWDRPDTRFEDTDLYRAFEAHFERDVDWEETAFFSRVVQLLDGGYVLWGCTTKEEFQQRCGRIDELYDSISERGYHSQRELMQDDIYDPLTESKLPWVVRFVYDKVTVFIGRTGDILLFDGRNRLAIAKLLDLDAIPVWVMVRQKQWQDLRENVAASPSFQETAPSRLDDHPDLQAYL